MATDTQRAQALADALTNRATPQAQIVQLADAILFLEGLDPAAFTLAQKARVILRANREWATGTIKRAENVAIAAAAVADHNATIDSDFAEA